MCIRDRTVGGISRSIVNTKQIFYVRKFFLEYNGARFGTGGLCFPVYYRNWVTERTFDPVSYTHLDVYKRQG